MTFEFELKVGDTVCSFGDCRGKVLHLNYAKEQLSSVTVKWSSGCVMTHPSTAEDIWLEGQSAKEHPDVKSHRWFIEHQDEINAQNTALLDAYKLALKQALETQANVVWIPEPVNENATLEELARGIADWSKIVTCLDGNHKDDYVKHDLFAREYLHGLLNGLKKQGISVSTELLEALAHADQYFIEHSIALAPPNIDALINRPLEKLITVQNLDAFWYEYRWPKAKL